jgi:hypothetical protein
MINYVKCMYLYIALLLVRASGRPGTLRPTVPTGRPSTIFSCAPGLGMSLGTWASPTRPEASTGRAWPGPIRTGPKRVRAGSVPGGPFGHLYPWVERVEKAAGGRSRALELVLKILSDVLGQHEHSSKVGVQSMACLEIG